MKYTVHFSASCPFANYCYITPAGSKSWIRTINRVERGMRRYNIDNGLYCGDWDRGTHPKHIWRTHCEFIDNPQADHIVTRMVFETEDKKQSWVIYITEDEE